MKCAFILCTHDSVFSGLWCELGKCCCFRWRNWGRCVLLSWVAGVGCLGSHHSPALTWWNTALALFCQVRLPDTIKLAVLLQGSWRWKMCICCLKGVLLFFLFLLFPLQFLVQNNSTCWRRKNKTKTNNWWILLTVLQWEVRILFARKSRNFYVVKKDKITVFSDFIWVDF